MTEFILYCKEVNIPLFHDISIFINEFNINRFDELYCCSSGIHLPKTIVSSSMKRKATYLAGRLAAKSALQSKGCICPIVTMAESKLPVWPSLFHGSISHSNSLAISSVARREIYKEIGVDVESVLSLDVSNKLTNVIMTNFEINFLNNRVKCLTKQQITTLCFSAKESLYKALYPYVLKFMNFDAAQIISLCENTQSFCIELTIDWNEDYKKGERFIGNFKLHGNSIITVVCRHKHG